MRAAGFIAMFCLAAAFQARADEPTPPAAADAATTPAAAAQPTVAAVATPIKPGITVVADPAALTPEDKEWLSRGYKLEVRNGEKYFCRREAEIGSRFERKTCNTAVILRAQRESAEEMLRRVQSTKGVSGN